MQPHFYSSLNINFSKIFRFLAFFIYAIFLSTATFGQVEWPEITQENKPWTRWWWMGSSVKEKNITELMKKYQEAGLGGVEITPIYGVAGQESEFIEYLSDEWISILQHTLQEGEKIGMGVDMATGSGWPFGGPWVDSEDASKYLAYKTFKINEGESLSGTISYTQEPIMRAVGYNVYGLENENVPEDAHIRAEIAELKDPISANENLQLLALDQVRFEKDLPLQVLMAYSKVGEHLDLTDKVDENGKLSWTAPEGDWTLYALFSGWHGKMVERAAPGGEGNVIDHFSEEALANYLEKFDEALDGQDIGSLRSFFNDSYEVDDAQGQANWTPQLLTEFQQRQGYDLREYLPALFGEDDEETNERILSDYRETVSDLLLEEFTQAWHGWAEEKGAKIRNQSHGSPANILDLYAASDIPETEGNEILRFKFATSAAHVTGKPLVSAESATWLNEHFTSSLADVREAVDRFFLGGVNHVFYHGTNYSPPEAEWPGWLFYAAVHFSPANPFWKDFPILNQYVARCQSFLQSGQSDNNVLVYFPIYDYYADRGRELLAHFDGFEENDRSSFHETAETLLQQGYGYDFISDRQLNEIEVSAQQISVGGSDYQTIILPRSDYIPESTWDRVMDLVEVGAILVVHQELPASLAGLHTDSELEDFEQQKSLLQFTNTSLSGIQEAELGDGKVIMGNDLQQLLIYAKIRREAMVDQGLAFIRRKTDDGHMYFVSNTNEEAMNDWVPLQVDANVAAIFDPMQQTNGLAETRNSEEGIEVYLQLSAGESLIIRTYETTVEAAPYNYYQAAQETTELKGTWKLTFTEGGPSLPSTVETSTLGSWTDLKVEELQRFSGTARYQLSFPRPEGDAEACRLSLGEVEQSAVVKLNGEVVGSLIGPDFSITIENSKIQDNNILEIEVTNGMANRIADLEEREVVWKKFYNINFPARLSENRNDQGLFTAKSWKPQPSGLIGPVTLTPLKKMTFK